MERSEILPSSFRDPSGFLFQREGTLYRQINKSYQKQYELLLSSGLYHRLVSEGLLIPHTEVDVLPIREQDAYVVIQPEHLPFVSYPYEWSFSQLKDAALVTLNIQKIALNHGMVLKDASAYNIQFYKGKPVLIDTLSFEVYEEGQPWDGYRQFCQHFLAPLALGAKTDIRLTQLLRVYIDGIPLDLVSKLLPFTSRLSLGLLLHIHLHARLQHQSSRQDLSSTLTDRATLNRPVLQRIADGLYNLVGRLQWKATGTTWADYYLHTNYTERAFAHKKQIVAQWIEATRPATLWDLGANNGEFTRLASQRAIPSVAYDIDPAAVEYCYRLMKRECDAYLLPLVMDLMNPSPFLGWQSEERLSLFERGPAEMAMALALIHHLVIANNIPLPRFSEFLGSVTSRWAVVEFIPKSDSQVQRLLSGRKDIFETYTIEHFMSAIESRFYVKNRTPIRESERVLFLLKKR